jgi:hypothetical protein
MRLASIRLSPDIRERLRTDRSSQGRKAAERTLDGEDGSERIGEEGKADSPLRR